MTSSRLVLLWAAVAVTALIGGPRLPLGVQVWVATALAVIAAGIAFIRLVYK